MSDEEGSARKGAQKKVTMVTVNFKDLRVCNIWRLCVSTTVQMATLWRCACGIGDALQDVLFVLDAEESRRCAELDSREVE